MKQVRRNAEASEAEFNVWHTSHIAGVGKALHA
jgi:hypothetical protein